MIKQVYFKRINLQFDNLEWIDEDKRMEWKEE